VRTIGEIAATPRPILARLLGEGQATHLSELAHGRDDREVVPYEAPKSVSHEETFERDLDAEEDILREVLHLAGRVGHRLRTEGFRARTVTLKVRLATFQTLTRSRTLPDASDVAAELYHVAAELYRALPGASRRVRLLGVAATGLEPAGAEQLALLHRDRWGDVERALDRIESRFGAGRAMPATLLDRGRDER
jgi:DNA polymerase-4